MAKVVFASALSRWLSGGQRQGAGEVSVEVGGSTVAQALEGAFALHPNLRGYVVDEHGVVRHHVALFVDGSALRDKRNLSQPLEPGSEVYVMQALSGG